MVLHHFFYTVQPIITYKHKFNLNELDNGLDGTHFLCHVLSWWCCEREASNDERYSEDVNK